MRSPKQTADGDAVIVHEPSYWLVGPDGATQPVYDAQPPQVAGPEVTTDLVRRKRRNRRIKVTE